MLNRWLKSNRKSASIAVTLVSAIAVISMTGCSLLGDVFGDSEYEGIVTLGFEVVSFAPCRGGEQWWMTGGDGFDELQTKYNSLTELPYEPVYAVLKGDRSGQGEYGHLGAYQREFEVSEVVEVRLPEEGECGIAGSVSERAPTIGRFTKEASGPSVP